MNRFTDKVVVVTGGANGLGLGAARRFAAEGARVWIADIDPATRDTGVSEGFEGAVLCDVGDSAAVDALFADVLARHGRLDVLFANAGVAGGAPVRELPDDLYHRIVRVNLDGVVWCCRAAARIMSGQRSGAIITTGSIFGRDGVAGSAAYCASKAGVIALSQSLARELAPYGVRVNCVSPGHMDTKLYQDAVARRARTAGVSTEVVLAGELAEVPLGRFGNPEDVAGLVTFLASDDARYITGQTINIDGGIQLR